VDAVVTDPPYGLKMHGGRIGKAKYAIESEWDNDPGDVVMIISLNVPTIIWGGVIILRCPRLNLGWYGTRRQKGLQLSPTVN
jgi:hypothetical protein